MINCPTTFQDEISLENQKHILIGFVYETDPTCAVLFCRRFGREDVRKSGGRKRRECVREKKREREKGRRIEFQTIDF